MSTSLHGLYADWAICFSKSAKVLGIAVRELESCGYRLWTIDREVDSILLRAGPVAESIAKSDAIYVPLPPAPFQREFFQFFSLASMGARSGRPAMFNWLLPKFDELNVPQWLLLAILRVHCVEWNREDARCGGKPRITTSLTKRDESILDVDVLHEPPFHSIPDSDDFEINTEENERVAGRYFVRPFAAKHHHAVTTLLAAFVRSGEFDQDDMKSLADELDLAIRSDKLNVPVPANECTYASAEYWVCVHSTVDGMEKVLGCVGLLTFYTVNQECWVAYLCGAGHGSILLDVVARRARQRGFNKLHIWTTKCNTDAVRLYRYLGFREVASPLLRDHVYESSQHAAFERELS